MKNKYWIAVDNAQGVRLYLFEVENGKPILLPDRLLGFDSFEDAYKEHVKYRGSFCERASWKIVWGPSRSAHD